MDERFHNEPDQYNRPPGSNSMNNPGRNSRTGDFKVNINYDDYSDGQRSSAQSRQQSGDKFKVSIPEQNERPAHRPSQQTNRPTQRPASQARRPSQNSQQGSSARRPASASPSGTRRPAPSASAQRKRPTKEQIKKAEKAKKQKMKEAKKAQKKAEKNTKKVLTPEQAAKEREAKKYKRTKGMLIICVSLIFITIITTTLSTLALNTINDILAINKDGGTTVSVSIPENATFDDVFNALCDSGLVNQKFLSKMFCKFRHYDEYYSSSKKKNVPVEYEAGVYYFETNDGLEAMLESIKVSKTSSKETVRLTFPEGWTIAQIFEKIEKYNVCTAEKLYANLDIIGKQFDFYEDIKADSGRYLKAEGYLFPDTYDFYIGESASSVLKKLFSNYESKWTSEFKQKAKDLGYSQDEVMIIASIIQREAKDVSQMKVISSVIRNRLADPATYPLLEMNSTRDYISSTNEYGVFTDFYYSLYLSSYNTYSEEGLPPGAICNPGIEAIEAALNPDDTNYHFFCHDSKGNIYLASTAAEHKANTEKILYETD